MKPSLVGAIDGENLSFAVARGEVDLRLDAVRQFKTSQFPTFTDALQGYIREQQLPNSGLELGLAVAGIAKGDVIAQANCRWYISVSGLRSFLASEPLVINDFAAVAWSLAKADIFKLRKIGPAVPRPVAPGRTLLAVGCGSGLGVATLACDENGVTSVMGSEGGHSSFSPQSAREDALLVAVRRRYGHVSFERLLAAAGLQNIYAWLSERDGGAVTPPEAAAIVAAAVGRRDQRAVEATDVYAEILGSFVGNSVLAAGAFDGVFLVGPMIESMHSLLQAPRFRSAFTGKGRMKKMLEPVPTSLVHEADAPLRGVATALMARRATKSMAIAC